MYMNSSFMYLLYNGEKWRKKLIAIHSIHVNIHFFSPPEKVAYDGYVSYTKKTVEKSYSYIHTKQTIIFSVMISNE